MNNQEEKKALAEGVVVAGFVPPSSPSWDTSPTSGAPAASALTTKPEGEYTPEWLKKIGGRKFALTVLVVVIFAVLIGLGIEVPDWFTALVGGLGASFNIGAGLARSGGR